VTRDIVAGWVSRVPPSYFDERGVDPAALLEGFDEAGPRAGRNLARMLDRFLETHGS
jgi:hypothetical protein